MPEYTLTNIGTELSTNFTVDLEQDYQLEQTNSWPQAWHRFTSESMWAVRSALAARRPLLVRGKPGLGKSQFARAVAAVANVPFFSQVIGARSEYTELLYHYDAVSRLAQAQLLGCAGDRDEKWRELLALEHFIYPGILWKAINWQSAQEQRCRAGLKQEEMLTDWTPRQGCVVLIDEIDKADADLPNGLLESLGNYGFHCHPLDMSITLAEKDAPLLVVVTTNEDRELPAAFLRRCLVLHMELSGSDEEQMAFVIKRAKSHKYPHLTDSVYQEAARIWLADRKQLPADSLVRPGPAEYLDLVCALSELAGRGIDPITALTEIKSFALQKNLPEDMRL